MKNLAICLLLLFSHRVSAQTCSSGFSGVYKVGPTGSFPSLKAAIDTLKKSGLMNAVVLELQVNYKSSVETFPVSLTSIPCADSIRSITIRPETGAVNLEISSYNDWATVDINTGTFFKIDGRSGGVGANNNLTVTNKNLFGSAVRFVNDACHNKLAYLNIRGNTVSDYSGVVCFGGTNATTGNDFNSIDHCNVFDETNTPANCVFALGEFGKPNTGTEISNCNLYNFFQRHSSSSGIFIGSANDSVTISRNSIYQTVERYYGSANVFGIRVVAPHNGPFTVSDNYVGGAAPLAANKMRLSGQFFFTGILMANGSGVQRNSGVDGNIIKNIVIDRQSGASTMIELRSFNGNCNKNKIGSSVPDSSIHMINNHESVSMTAYGIVETGLAIDSSNINYNEIGGIYMDNASPNPIDFYGILLRPISSSGPIRYGIRGNTIGHSSYSNAILNEAGGSVSAIHIQNSAGMSNLTVADNTIANLASTNLRQTGTMRGISFFGNLEGTCSIVNNTIHHLNLDVNTPGFPAVAGINSESTGTTNATFNYTGNIIHTLSSQSSLYGTGSHAVHGIYVYSFVAENIAHNVSNNIINSLDVGDADRAYHPNAIGLEMDVASCRSKVFNNVIRIGIDSGGNSLASAATYIGIADRKGSNNYYHNSVFIAGVSKLISGSGSGKNRSACFQRSGFSDAFCAVYNNIFVNARSNATHGYNLHNCIYLSLSGPNYSLDNNLYYVGSSDGSLGSLPANENIKTLEAWKINTQQETNSLFAKPNFVNATGSSATVDLHLKNQTPAEGKGSLLWTSDYDVDGERRSMLSPVDIGADAGNFTYSLPTSDSVSLTFCPPVANATIDAISKGNNYQWQVNSGRGFASLQNGSYYFGTNTSRLGLNNFPSSLYGYQLRCLVDGDATRIYTIKFSNTWVGTDYNAWEHDGNWSCGAVPDQNTDVIINSGDVLINSNVTVRTLTINPAVKLTVGDGRSLKISR